MTDDRNTLRQLFSGPVGSACAPRDDTNESNILNLGYGTGGVDVSAKDGRAPAF